MVVHILVHGLPICGFSRELPCNWPMGHKWVRVEEHSDASCSTCKRIAEQAFPPKRETDEPPLVIPACADDLNLPCVVPPEGAGGDEDEDWEYGYGGYI